MALSGQKTVTTAGTEVVLGAQWVNGPLLVKAKSANTGLIYLGNNGDGTVSSTTGIILPANAEVRFEWVGYLGDILVDSSVNGEGVSWIMLEA